MKKEIDRFKNWNFPKINDGIPTEYNWIVKNTSGFRLGYKTDIGSFTYINAGNVLELVTMPKLGHIAQFIQYLQSIIIQARCKL